MKSAAIAFISLVLLGLACSAFPFAFSQENGLEQEAQHVDLSGYFLPDPAVGLEALQSYTQTLSISFNGSQDGEALEFEDTYRQELNRETHTQFTFSDITNLEGGMERIFAGNIGEAYYLKRDAGECRVSWGERAEGSEPIMPARLLPPLLAVSESGLEELDGVQTRRYDFDAASLGYPATTKVEGQLWLAEEGGYVIKYRMLIQDDGGLFGAGVKGERGYEYELSQINAVEVPKLPEGCLSVLTDFPSMPDAFDIQRLPGVLAYASVSDKAQIQGFYEQQLQDQGWIVSSSHSLLEEGITLVFLQMEDFKIAYITLQAAGVDTWVTVKVEPLGNALPGTLP